MQNETFRPKAAFLPRAAGRADKLLEDGDIEYFYKSKLQTEGAPVEDIHFHPVEPRTLRLTLTAHF